MAESERINSRLGVTVRVLLAALLGVVLLLNPAVAQADPNCIDDGPPPGSASKPFDGGTVWISPDGMIGVTTAGGNGRLRVPNAGPMPLQALVINAQGDGGRQLIVSNGRVARLFILAGCKISAAYDGQGEPFSFDLQNLRGTGTGVGCGDLGNGPHLLGLQALPDGVRRTQIDLDAFMATLGPSDIVPVATPQDPVVVWAQNISCGDQTMANDGVQQP